MIIADQLTKIYGRFAATKDVSFRISRGEIVCFLGPNGAGKSTTMKMLTGFLTPTSGTAKIAGFDMTTDRLIGAKHLGYLPENGPLYPDMTPYSLLRFFASVRKISKITLKSSLDRVIELCDLTSVIQKPIGQLSRGYRQRVGMAQALLHEPDVLILDEPTAGLDPNQIHQVRQTIRKIGEKKTILLSTHILQEVNAVASRVIFINKGQIVFDGSVNEFGKSTDDFDRRFQELTLNDCKAVSPMQT
ncbi:MAG: ATP-binding cassette domain-containing protein [Planctomycetia bacterium]|nr:ATP-binding cassette domain-containing protein [Planctomycetia bacterium]